MHSPFEACTPFFEGCTPYLKVTLSIEGCTPYLKYALPIWRIGSFIKMIHFLFKGWSCCDDNSNHYSNPMPLTYRILLIFTQSFTPIFHGFPPLSVVEKSTVKLVSLYCIWWTPFHGGVNVTCSLISDNLVTLDDISSGQSQLIDNVIEHDQGT